MGIVSFGAIKEKHGEKLEKCLFYAETELHSKAEKRMFFVQSQRSTKNL